MTRAKHDHLSASEARQLLVWFGAGVAVSEIARRLNVSKRNVYMRTAGSARTSIAVDTGYVRHKGQRICWVGDCIAPVYEAARFCDVHEPKPRPALTGSTIPPPTMARLMGGR